MSWFQSRYFLFLYFSIPDHQNVHTMSCHMIYAMFKCRQATDQLKALLARVPTILNIKDDEKLKEALGRLERDAATCKDHAQGAFRMVEKAEDKIRAVQIAVTTLICTRFIKDGDEVRTEIEQEILKLLEHERVLLDASHQLASSQRSSSFNINVGNFTKERQERIKSVINVILHAEAFAITNKLDPILPRERNDEVVKRGDIRGQNYPVKALIQSGIFEGKTTISDLEGLEGEDDGPFFSEKEICVMAGFLGEWRVRE